MISANGNFRTAARLLSIDADGGIRHRRRADLATLFVPGDLVVANDAATLPASLFGTHVSSGAPLEIRLAAWVTLPDPTRFVAIAFGAGDHRTPTEHRPPPPPLTLGDRLAFGPLSARIQRFVGHPRLMTIRFVGGADAVRAGIARHGRPIQYAHIREPLPLRDFWTKIAASPIAFEPPSAGFVLDWATVAAWRRRGIGFVTLTHAAGISSTGDPALDRRLPFDEPYRIPAATAAAIDRAKSNGGRVVAIGTTVVRALECAAGADGIVRAGEGVATGRVGHQTPLGVVNALLSGVHAPGENHYELLRAFADDDVLQRMTLALEARGYRTHEFGDSVLIQSSRHGSYPIRIDPPGNPAQSSIEMPA